MTLPPPGKHTHRSDFFKNLFRIRALYERFLSIQVFVLTILLAFIVVNSYVLSRGTRMSTLICALFHSLIIYSRAPSGAISCRMYVVIFVSFLFHAHTNLIRSACTMLWTRKCKRLLLSEDLALNSNKSGLAGGRWHFLLPGFLFYTVQL